MPRNNQGKSESETSAVGRKKDAPGNDFDAAHIRARELSKRIEESPVGKDRLVLEALEELRTTIEELQVAEEESRQQNEEILAAHSTVEAERLKYESLFEGAPDAYIVTDASGSILKANAAASRLLDVSRRFLKGKPLVSYIVPADHDMFFFELDRLLKSAADTESVYLRVLPRNGEPFHAALRVSPTTDREGKFAELRWLMRDVTKLRNSAEQARLENLELEERVRRRTAELEQVSALKDEFLLREQRARAAAEAANRSKDEFLAIVSHELRTPLNAILGWAQLLCQDGSDDAHRIHAAEVIERSARAQARLINDILDVSRVISGGLPLDKRPVNVARIVEAAVEAARPSIQGKGIQLSVNIDRTAGVVVGDSVRLQQVIGNLLSNSTKFTNRRGKIAVGLEQVSGSLSITVTDTGQGISAEFLPYVFERFRQGDSQITRQHGGMGLGLAIVKILVELHGGTVSAASEGLEKGSTFTITLPIATESRSSTEEQLTDLQHPNGSDAGGRLASLWVVVVDDDYDAREMMRAVLESSGARVTTCGSYAEALGLLNEKATGALSSRLPDVLVADIAMPERDGYDLIRAVRRLEPQRGGRIPAIALTAYADEETRQRALGEGYQVHLTKPLNLADLVGAIANLGERHFLPHG